MAQDEEMDPAEAAFREVLAKLDAIERKVAALPKGRLPPDTSDTLAEILALQKALGARLAAFKLDTGVVAAEVRAAVDGAVGPAMREVREATAGVQGSTRHFDRISAHIATGRDQKAERNWWAAGGVAIGVVLCMLSAGPLARLLPASWAVPEKLAAATLHQDRATAGQQMIASVNPQEWAASVAAIRLSRANQEVLAACRAAARRVDRAKLCEIRVGPGS